MATSAKPQVDVEPIKIKVMGLNIFPMLRGVHKIMNRTEAKRRQNMVKQNAPNPDSPLLDYYDCKKETPYEIEEVLEGQVWKVMYKTENFPMTKSANKKVSKMFGFDPNSLQFQQKLLTAAKAYGETAVEVVQKDIEKLRKDFLKTDWADEEKVSAQSHFLSNMLVVKLNNGGLVLYAPVKMHKDDAPHLIVDWLKSLGPVEWLVCASQAHTLSMGDAISAFPDAKVVGPEFAQEKLKYAKMLKKDKFEYLTDQEEGIAELNKEMEELGLEFVFLDGDNPVCSVICCAHKQIVLECDVLYGHHNKKGIFVVDEERFLEFRPEDYNFRAFKLGQVDLPNSPHGHLPNYRYWLMDPDATASMSCWNLPPTDCTHYTRMADSLRKVNSLEFHTAVGVHHNPMKAEDFKKSIDASWNWLDGKPLM